MCVGYVGWLTLCVSNHCVLYSALNYILIFIINSLLRTYIPYYTLYTELSTLLHFILHSTLNLIRTYSMLYCLLHFTLHSMQRLLPHSLFLPSPDQWEQCIRHAGSAGGEDAEQPGREGPHAVCCPAGACASQRPRKEEGTHHAAE